MQSKTEMPVLQFLFLALVAAGCGDAPPTPRTYQEVLLRPDRPPVDAAAPMRPSGMDDVASTRPQITWTAPDGWTEEPGDSVRLGTFRIGAGECSITAFPGDVGGLEANVRRWLGQMGAQDPPADAMEEFLAGGETLTSTGGLRGRIFELARFVPDAGPDSTAILSGVFSNEGSTVFVKLTGPISLLSQEREQFTELCRSLQ